MFVAPLARHGKFLAFWILSLAVFHSTVAALLGLSYNDYRYSHLMVIPPLAVYLLWRGRRKIFLESRYSLRLGAAAVASALLLSLAAAGSNSLALATLAMVGVWMAGFLLCYGVEALKRAAFAWLFLLLLVPVPPATVDRAIAALQTGSAEMTFLLLRLAGVPVFRQGYAFSLPGVNIEVAAECSSIRSATALLLTSLLAGHAFLRSNWRRSLLVLLTPVFAVCSNAVRIATIASLSVYVDPSYLTGNLHHRGGSLFALVSVTLLLVALFVLQKSEARSRIAGNQVLTAAASSPVSCPR